MTEIMKAPALPMAAKGVTLVTQISDALRAMILHDELKPGDKLPSEARISELYGVSRTVVREAIAALRSDGLVEPRRGAGVFVMEMGPGTARPFQGVDHARISSIVELIELRAAVESEAAALAAIRRSPAQEEAIIERHREVQACIEAGRPTVDADFALHRTISEATNNSRFAEFMDLVGPNAIPRASVQLPADPEYLGQIHREHDRIVTAISNRESEAARAAMQEHLLGSQRRYRALLRRD
ncbi:transcriptional regulator, GntR family [Devosia lucknowensis]|uniref:Transcriptional regulator, GntR family n=2 Tax=Devosia lucknowensis TaxID=1096929 RepID=A0A1Y6G6H9_9HYPH|nr:FadR/GntR family transcriptional regulator [Devosia lucknowensis]SMQ85772.1 transcriptional regulator, GntR family [Devosia lucknowensis]